MGPMVALLLALAGVAHADPCDDTGLQPWDTGVVDADCDEDGYQWLADGDCDDRNPDVHPGQVELCDDFDDNNCDGFFNEGCDGVMRRGTLTGGSSCTGGAGGAALLLLLPVLLVGRKRR